ncbi:MAG: hypothetical protein QJR14_01960 [Bacillota bacterium]|nr:hypothetical protein [Bacillota bacterium]
MIRSTAQAGLAPLSTGEELLALPGVLRLAVWPEAVELESAQENRRFPRMGEPVHVLDGHLHPRPAGGGRSRLAAFYYFEAPGVTVRVIRDGGALYCLASRGAAQAVL